MSAIAVEQRAFSSSSVRMRSRPQNKDSELHDAIEAWGTRLRRRERQRERKRERERERGRVRERGRKKDKIKDQQRWTPVDAIVDASSQHTHTNTQHTDTLTQGCIHTLAHAYIRTHII